MQEQLQNEGSGKDLGEDYCAAARAVELEASGESHGAEEAREGEGVPHAEEVAGRVVMPEQGDPSAMNPEQDESQTPARLMEPRGIQGARSLCGPHGKIARRANGARAARDDIHAALLHLRPQTFGPDCVEGF